MVVILSILLPFSKSGVSDNSIPFFCASLVIEINALPA